MQPTSGRRRTPLPTISSTYRAKRSADTTPEPFGGRCRRSPGRLFVVHKHAARHLHFDLRLEMDGVLRSWAVPRGPSYDMDDKRLAVKVEDHPLEYGDFEGIIPAGNYGAGGVIVWDRGEWVPLEDWREGLEKGKLLFELRGYKLHGKWTLVKIKKSEKDWLLIKERDAYVEVPGDQFAETRCCPDSRSRKSRTGGAAGAAICGAAVEEAGAIPRTRRPRLGRSHARRAGRQGVHARRLDLRAQARRLSAARQQARRRSAAADAQRQRLHRRVSRGRARDEGAAVRAIASSTAKSSCSTTRASRASRGCSSADALTSPLDVQRAAVELAGDVLRVRPARVRGLRSPIAAARRAQGTPPGGAVRSSAPSGSRPHRARGRSVSSSRSAALGLEGIIAKKADAPYRGGRSDAWLKIKAEQTGDFVIVGFTEPKGTAVASARCSSPTWSTARSSTRAASEPDSTTSC